MRVRRERWQGVHLTVDLCQRLQSRFPSCVPFLIYISNEVWLPGMSASACP